MPFRGLLRRKSKSKLSGPYENDGQGETSEKANSAPDNGEDLVPPVPVVKIMRSTTHSQELLTAPSFSPVAADAQEKLPTTQNLDPGSMPQRSNTMKNPKSAGKRLSNLLHLNRRSRAASAADMPVMSGNIPPFPARGDAAADEGADSKTEEERQAQWEKRATLLVQGTTKPVSLPPSPAPPIGEERKSFDFTAGTGRQPSMQDDDWPLRTPSGSQQGSQQSEKHHHRPTSPAAAADAEAKSMEEKNDDDIQLAIQLHESGDLATSTSMFGRLADPNGANNALAQVLYGLALRHGWGIAPNPDLAVQYLTQSARNASHLSSALGNPSTSTSTSTTKPTSKTAGTTAGLNRGELTLAIYELGNCHRNGWGVAKSLPLAMQYFETAAELGDTDAMVEVAMAWEKGVKGWHDGKKDKGQAARWYRRAEKAGRKEVGNSWIWKEKYDLPVKR